MVLYKCIQHLYKNSVDGRLFIAKWWITMSVILDRTPSIQRAAALPRKCTKPVEDVRLWSCTAPYSGCTKILLLAECSMANGELP